MAWVDFSIYGHSNASRTLPPCYTIIHSANPNFLVPVLVLIEKIVTKWTKYKIKNELIVSIDGGEGPNGLDPVD